MRFDFAHLGVLDHYKLMTSTIVPRPIAWVVSRSAVGTINIAPFSFFNMFSGVPPLVCIGVGSRGPGARKDSARNISETGEFVICLVTEALSEVMNFTAIDFPGEVDEAAASGLELAPSGLASTPRIAASPVAFECRRYMTIEVGDARSIIVGEVLAMEIADRFVDPKKLYVDTPALRLIGRMHGGDGYVRLTDLFKMPRLPLPDASPAATEAARSVPAEAPGAVGEEGAAAPGRMSS
ncbi:MAG TPA: flavin reductase family protein [Caulobacteraceae bacterium]|nr:flavin reductase family protein [Caulobacteraceae bacterium]